MKQGTNKRLTGRFREKKSKCTHFFFFQPGNFLSTLFLSMYFQRKENMNVTVNEIQTISSLVFIESAHNKELFS